MTPKDIKDMIENEETIRESIASDFEHNYFVEAGAGAGKTKLVVDRITNQLKSGIKPEEIAAITFTNKAAQELCKRISDNLRRVSSADPNYANVQAALRDIGRMQISTIHSFCHRILKENCFGARLRLDFELLEEEGAIAQKKKFFNNWFNKNVKLYKDLQAECSENLSYSDLERNFLAICELPERVVFKYEDIEDVTPEKIAESETKSLECKEIFVKAFIAALEDELTSSTADSMPVQGMKYNDPDMFKYLKSGYSPDDDINTLYSSIINIHCPFKKNRKGMKDNPDVDIVCQAAYDRVSTEAQNAEDIVNLTDNISRARVNTLVLPFILLARKEYRKQNFNRYITNDLLLQKANALLDDAMAVERIRNTFKCIYVDEFQDTDPIQNEMVLKICMKDGEFIPGLLFLVGDVKQSIYRFREADYRLFNATKETFIKHPLTCKVESLNINNRSNADLVDFYNTKVKSLPAGLIPGYTEMVPRHGHRDKDAVHGVYKVIGNNPFRNPKRKTSEPEKIVGIIRHLLGRTICYFNPETKIVEKKEIEYKDFLILTTKSTGNADYVNTLQNMGIPARVSEEYFPGTLYPLKRFVAIYRYLAMPYYKRAKEALLEIAQQDTSFELANNGAMLDAWRKAVSGMSGAELAGWLMEQSELYIFNKDFIAGCKVKRFQMAIRQMVDQILSKCEDNPVVIAEALAEYIDESYSCEREIGYDKNENAVRLMNIHKAKGLEGNIVIIAQRAPEKKNDTTYTKENERYQIICTYNYRGFPSKYFPAYAMKPLIKRAADQERDMEQARLEYVAVTRAKEALIFMDYLPNDKSDTPDGAVFHNYVSDDIPELFDVYPVEDGVDLLAEDEITSGADILHSPEAGEDVSSVRGYKVSPSTMEVHAGYKPEVTDDELKEDLTEPTGETEYKTEDKTESEEDVSESSELLQKRPSGDIFGTVMHRAFELAVKGIRSGNLNSDYCIDRALNENIDDIELRYKASAATETDAFKAYLSEKLPEFVDRMKDDILKADEVYTEYPFSMTVSGDELREIKSLLNITEHIAKALPVDGTEDSNSVWISGQADLILQYGNDIVIWDYKSDKIKELSEEDFIKKVHDTYDNQMNLYKWVFGKKFANSISGRFYSVEIGRIEK